MSVIDYKETVYGNTSEGAQFEHIFSKLDVLFILLDEKLTIASLNDLFSESIELEREDLLGKNFLDLLEPASSTAFHQKLKLCLNRGYLKSEEAVLVTGSGRLLPCQVNGQFDASRDEGPAIRLYLRDASDRVRLARRNALALQLAKRLREAGDPETALKAFLSDCQRILACDGIGFASEKSGGERLCLGKWRGLDSPGAGSDFRGWPSGLWRSLAEKVRGASPGPAALPDGFLLQDRPDAGKAGNVVPDDLMHPLRTYRSLAVCGLPLSGSTGTLVLGDRRPGAFDLEDVLLLREWFPAFLQPRAKTGSAGRAAPEAGEHPA
jgi:PAS domain S-box-containing protein